MLAMRTNFCVSVLSVLTAIAGNTSADDSRITAMLDADEHAVVTKHTLRHFEARRFVAGPDGDGTEVYYYRLFKPKPNPSIETFPLVVWVHGHGQYELKLKNMGQLAHVRTKIFCDLDHPEKYPFYFLAVQCPEDSSWISSQWTDDGTGDLDPAGATLAIVDSLMNEFPIDASRVTLVGISSGGTASWEMAKRRPDLFSAVAPLGSLGTSADGLHRIKHVAVWAFHSKADTQVPVDGVRETIAALSQLGGKCALTESRREPTESRGEAHDCWTAAFLDYELLDWLLAQQRESVEAPLPGNVGIWTTCRLAGRSMFQTMKGAPWGSVAVCVSLVAIIWASQRELLIRLAAKRGAAAASSSRTSAL